MIEKHGFLEIIRVLLLLLLLRLLVLPKLNSTTTSTTIVVVQHIFIGETWRGGEERDDAHSDAQSGGGRGVGSVNCVMMMGIGDDGFIAVVVVVVVVVER